LATISVPVGSSVKVISNARGKFEIYLKTNIEWDRVALQDGTIEISAEIYDYALGRFGFDVEVFDSQYFDEEPVIETRKIIQAINEELLVGDLLVKRNELLTLMFNFVLSEFAAPEWLMKTSLIDVDHKIRELVPFQNYIRDNQDFVSGYIQEVKPYHVQVREFNLKYSGIDEYFGDTTDFDIPAFYNTTLITPQYVSPILLPYAHSAPQAFNFISDTPADSTVWSRLQYNQWYNNYTLYVDSIYVANRGSGYTVPPVLYIVPADGDTTGSGATAVATLNSQGQVVDINVTNAGNGYTQTPMVVFVGGNGISALAYPIMANNLVRSFRTVIKYDRYEYNSLVETWNPVGTYVNGTLVRYADRVWQAKSYGGSTSVSGPEFNLEDWVEIDAAALSGVNRTMGLYIPGVNSPGLDLGLLIDGINYPGVQVWGDYFLGEGSNPDTPTITCTYTEGTKITCNETLRLVVNAQIKFYGETFGGIIEGQNYFVSSVLDATHFTISIIENNPPIPLITASGTMIAYVPEPADALYASSFSDQYLGLRPTDINVDGGQFIGPYEGHAPEELVNGSEFDTLDLRVYTRPGSDWTHNGHGFKIGTVNWVYEPTVTNTYSWADAVLYPFEIIVTNTSTGLVLARAINYTVDWAMQTISILSNVTSNDIIGISVFEIGGGSQLFRGTYTGTDVGDSVIIPVNAAEIYELLVFRNGVLNTNVTWSAYIPSTDWDIIINYQIQSVVNYLGVYYRAIRTVPVGIVITNATYWLVYVPTTQSIVNFHTTYGANDGISLVAMGTETPQYSWSNPQTQYIVADQGIVNSRTLNLSNSIAGTNPANLIVTRNGVRLRPADGIEWIGDATSFSFGLPQRGGYSQELINAYTDITVWVDNELQVQNYGPVVGDYYVTNYTGSNTPGRQILFFTPPASGVQILISVDTESLYSVITQTNQIQLALLPNIGDVFAVTTWNDTAQQNILTLVFQGPTTKGITLNEPYDSTDYDLAVEGAIDAPGSYDFTLGILIPINDFNLGRDGQSANRLWVTLDGYRLSEGQDYTVDGQYLIYTKGAIGAEQVMVITEFTQSQTPEAISFRIFQDMAGNQTTYRITEDTTTYLTQEVTATDDVIHVKNAANLSEPVLDTGYFGIITIDGERILYRVRDITNNIVSGLHRGTAGTAAASHEINADVYELGVGNRMKQTDQNYIVSNTYTGDGSTVVFYGPNIDNDNFDGTSAQLTASIEVYIGGIRAVTGWPTNNIVVGTTYTIASIGTTNWHTVGVPSNVIPMVGYVFTASANGAGTGIVGSTLASYYYAITVNDPITVTFITTTDLLAPPVGQAVTLLQRRSTTWYAPGVGTPSDGVALQETNTEAARFLRGL